jgi:hypothetical protein
MTFQNLNITIITNTKVNIKLYGVNKYFKNPIYKLFKISFDIFNAVLDRNNKEINDKGNIIFLAR